MLFFHPVIVLSILHNTVPMKNTPTLLALAIAGLIVAGVLLSGSRETFGVPEFIDRSAQVRRETGELSSYVQQTTHLRAADSHQPPRGQETGHRVGQWWGYNSLF